jgi:hypothetical protein
MDRQYVGIDFHRRCSVIVREDAAGEQLSSVRVPNDALAVVTAVAEAGREPEVVIEATYGWYWAVDLLQDLGTTAHLANSRECVGIDFHRRRSPHNPINFASSNGSVIVRLSADGKRLRAASHCEATVVRTRERSASKNLSGLGDFAAVQFRVAHADDPHGRLSTRGMNHDVGRVIQGDIEHRAALRAFVASVP